MFIVYSNAEAIPILYKHDIHLLKHTQSVSLQGMIGNNSKVLWSAFILPQSALFYSHREARIICWTLLRSVVVRWKPAKTTERWAISSRDILSSGSSSSKPKNKGTVSLMNSDSTAPSILKQTGVLSLCLKTLQTFELSHAQRSSTASSLRQTLGAPMTDFSSPNMQ